MIPLTYTKYHPLSQTPATPPTHITYTHSHTININYSHYYWPGGACGGPPWRPAFARRPMGSRRGSCACSYWTRRGPAHCSPGWGTWEWSRAWPELGQRRHRVRASPAFAAPPGPSSAHPGEPPVPIVPQFQPNSFNKGHRNRTMLIDIFEKKKVFFY